jgi:hypothetical protein
MEQLQTRKCSQSLLAIGHRGGHAAPHKHSQGASSPAPAAPSHAHLITSVQTPGLRSSRRRAAPVHTRHPLAGAAVQARALTPRTAAPSPRSRAEAKEPHKRAAPLKSRNVWERARATPASAKCQSPKKGACVEKTFMPCTARAAVPAAAAS